MKATESKSQLCYFHVFIILLYTAHTTCTSTYSADVVMLFFLAFFSSELSIFIFCIKNIFIYFFFVFRFHVCKAIAICNIYVYNMLYMGFHSFRIVFILFYSLFVFFQFENIPEPVHAHMKSE